MDEPDAAAAFERAGSQDGPLVPQYELCARSMSRLLVPDGTVLDLGSGSGRYLDYFAERRPDAEVVGVELSSSMVKLSEQARADGRRRERVRLVQADMTDCLELLPAKLDLLSCMLALHQLPSAEVLSAALGQIATIREKTGCAVWIWDLVRLQDDSAIRQWMSRASESDALFHRDALASEAAAWTLQELEDALEQAGLGWLQHTVAQPPLLQAHWAPAAGRSASDEESAWQDIAMPSELRRRVIALRLGFRGLP